MKGQLNLTKYMSEKCNLVLKWSGLPTPQGYMA